MNSDTDSINRLCDDLYHVAESLRYATKVKEYQEALEKNRILWESLRVVAHDTHLAKYQRVRDDVLSKATWVEAVYAEGMPLSDHVVEQLIIVDLQTYAHLRAAVRADYSTEVG